MSLLDLKNSFESNFTELQSLLEYATKIEEEKKQLESFDARLRTREKSLEERERQYQTNTTSLKQSEEFVDKKATELSQKEGILAKLDERKEELRVKEEEIAKKVEENKKILTNLGERLKEADNLKLRVLELDHREALLQKEVLADRERKQFLDQKEADLQAEEARLQKIAERLG